jgi:CRP-like cAMP-binding protein
MFCSLSHPSQLEKSYLFQPQDLLPSRFNSLWKIESGVVKVTTYSENGDLIVLGLWGEGDLVGKKLGTIEPYDIICLTKVKASLIPFNNELDLRSIFASHLQQIQELTVIRSYKTVDLMLLKLLIWLGQKFGRKTDQGNLIDVRLTHQELADLIGSTRVTITRILSQLEQQGLIQKLSLQRIILNSFEI